jgi:hypothetical protein
MRSLAIAAAGACAAQGGESAKELMERFENELQRLCNAEAEGRASTPCALQCKTPLCQADFEKMLNRGLRG